VDDFTKTKIGFTIALLVAAFAFKPLVDAYGDNGFLFFDYMISIKLAFFTAVGFLGIAVYCISLQFIFTKKIAVFDRTSNITYALSLTTPIVFAVFWLLIIVVGWFAKILTDIPEQLWLILAAAISGALMTQISNSIIKVLKQKDTESKREENRKQEFELLSRSDSLIEEGHYDLALLESWKIMELTLRQAVILASGESKMFTTHAVIRHAQELNLLSDSDLYQIHEIRTLRNNATHLDSEINKEQAIRAVAVAKRLIKTLSFARDISGYNWLKVNRPEGIKAMRGENKQLLDTVKKHLWEAWVRRDGAISYEISEFFEAGLLHNPQIIIDMFITDNLQFEAWLDHLSSQIFTDFAGGQTNQLEQLKTDILDSLENYIESAKNYKEQNMAKRLKDEIAEITIREIV